MTLKTNLSTFTFLNLMTIVRWRIFEILEFCKENEIPVLFITMVTIEQRKILKIYKIWTNNFLQVLDANKHRRRRGLNIELMGMQKYNWICTKTKNFKHIKIDIDLGLAQYKKLNYYLKKILVQLVIHQC